MALGIGPDTPLPVRLTWLAALRLAVLTILLGFIAWIYAADFAWNGRSGRVALVTVAAAYLVAAVYASLLRVGRALDAIAYAQLATDQITWTAFVYVTGGVSSGATSLYGLTCLSGAILLGVRGAAAAAAFGVACFLGLTAALAEKLIEPPGDLSVIYKVAWSDAAFPIFVNLLAVAVVTSLASYLAERLRTTGGRLAVVTKRAEEAERLAALGALAAGLAHEIRNPLGSIRGSIELLRTGGSLSAEDQRLCEIIERETARVNDLIGDLLDLSRPRQPEKADLDLSQIARDVVTLAARSGRGSDVTVRCVAPARAMVFADQHQMRQIVWNLVRNAVQASSANDDVLVQVRPISSGSQYALEIIDNGPGIPRSSRERLFDAFFTTRSHGVGIGLAVVKRIADDHGFAVEVDSEPGGGTTFRVIVPAVQGPAEVEAAPPEAAEVGADSRQ